MSLANLLFLVFVISENNNNYHDGDKNSVIMDVNKIQMLEWSDKQKQNWKLIRESPSDSDKTVIDIIMVLEDGKCCLYK